MNNFTFESKQKMLFGGMMGVGVLCLILSLFMDDLGHQTRFWSNFMHNSIFFTGIAAMVLFFVAASVTAWGGWYTVFKRLWESMYSFLLGPALILVGIMVVAVYGDFAHVYHWMHPGDDEILIHKSSFLNKNWYAIASVVIVGAWAFFGNKLRSLSLAEDNGNGGFAFHNKIRVWSAAFLPILGFSSAAIIWQWVMSVDAHWYSTLFAWYSGASWFVSGMALTVILLIYFQGKGYFSKVTGEHIHDLGKLVFAFSIFWTYLWFSQFMLIWYANVGEETIYFYERMNDYPVLFFGNLVLNFITPFFVLMRNDTKRKRGTLLFASCVVLFGHWIDYFLMLKPGILHTALHGEHASGAVAGFSLPGLIEVGTFIGFLGLFLFMTFRRLSKMPLEAKNDPYLDESVHHHVGYGGAPLHHGAHDHH